MLPSTVSAFLPGSLPGSWLQSLLRRLWFWFPKIPGAEPDPHSEGLPNAALPQWGQSPPHQRGRVLGGPARGRGHGDSGSLPTQASFRSEAQDPPSLWGQKTLKKP